MTVSVVPGTAPTSDTVPPLASDATVWLKPARSSVAPAATVCDEPALSAFVAVVLSTPCRTSVPPA
ncbi:hypothetical protein [Variovorax sp. UC122_21]|uniref:hypothetical protein n=1 Tax=Variovorax sp. UC122_21 TaxID=3374554 RepID=UPI00375736B4